MQEVLNMAKVHLQNVVSKIEELENQKNVLQGEIEKLKAYLHTGVEHVETFATTLENQAKNN